MATSPPLPSPKPGTASPNDSLRRDASKKEGVKGWMGTLTRRKKTDEVNALETEGKNAIDTPLSPAIIIPNSFKLEETEERTMVEPASLEDPKVHELMNNLLEWINSELAEKRIVVRDLEEDLYDGQILSILMEKLAKIKFEFSEVTQSVGGQIEKLEIILNKVEQLVRIDKSEVQWTATKIHNKDIVSILHLLVALKEHFSPNDPITPGVYMRIVVVQKQEGLLNSKRVNVQITKDTEEVELEKQRRRERDAFDALFENAPEKLNVVKKSLQNFVNRHLTKLNLEVNDIDTQFHDGVHLIFLIGLLEGYFVPLYRFKVTPSGFEQKVKNVAFAFELMDDSSVPYPRCTPEDIVTKDLKSTLRILYALFQKYKNSK
ncbi:Alpha-parvin [Paramuricea clavata]|uniref:Alpha-parvin n=1 Tax=Paramuricea clavata TaxID=317549 RepID=A0A7D9EKR2_PARCT|nr:Alpha-parvin [Paramuricea clavata]